MAVIELNVFNQLEGSLTAKCVQYGWGSKYYFPCYPKKTEIFPLEAYFHNFKVGSVFAYNDDTPKLM